MCYLCSNIHLIDNVPERSVSILCYEPKNKYFLSDGCGHVGIEINFCPWCGKKLIESNKENTSNTQEKDETHIIDIPKDGHYIEILGNRIYRNDKWNADDATDSWNAFLEYLYNCEQAKKENEVFKNKLIEIELILGDEERSLFYD